MVSFASRYRMPTSIRKDRPLTNDELQRIVPSAFSSDKHDSRSERYTYIPTINILDRLRDEGFQPYYATQSRTRDQDKRDFTKHMLRLRRQVCSNGLVAWKDFGEIRVPHKGDIVGQVIEGAYTVLKTFDAVDENIDLMKSIQLTLPEQRLFGATALELKYDGKPAPITPEQIINPRRVLDRGQDLWTTFNVVQENVIRGGIRGRTEKGKMTRTREVTGIDGDIKLNQVLWKMADEFAKLKA